MASDDCIHLLPKATCAICTPRRGSIRIETRTTYGPAEWDALSQLASEATGEYGPWTRAEHGGFCQGCGQYMEPGMRMRYSNDEGGWTGACCSREE
jgi:hypothetical protein